MKVLISDDDADVRRMLEALIGQYGECEQVDDGRRCFHKFCEALKSEEAFDLICMDLNMPSMNGIEAIRKIREIETTLGVLPDRKVIIIVISGYEEDGAVANAKQAGAEAYIPKPHLTRLLEPTLKRLGLIP